MDSPRLIEVGRIAGGFGVRGEVRITAFTEDPLALAGYGELLRQDGSPLLSIKTARAVKGAIIARCSGIDTRDQADALRGVKLFVPRDRLPEPDEDEFYLTDLIGLQARDASGAVLGAIKAVPNYGAGDLLEIDPGQGRPTWYLPFTREAAPEVRVSEGYVLVVRPAEVSEKD